MREPGTFHDMWLESTYKALGDLYRDTGRTAQSEEMLVRALEIHKHLYGLDSEACSIYLADIYHSLGGLYKITGRLNEAEDAYAEALRRYEVNEAVVTLFAKGAADTRERLMELRRIKAKDAVNESILTPEEKEVALLLTEGDTQRDIARRLHLSASEVSQRVKAIRDKVSMGEYDQVIAAIVKKYKLSGRETDILRCLRRNMTNAEIAAERFLSEETVRVHIHNLIKKLPVETRSDISGWVTAFEAKPE